MTRAERIEQLATLFVNANHATLVNLYLPGYHALRTALAAPPERAERGEGARCVIPPRLRCTCGAWTLAVGQVTDEGENGVIHSISTPCQPAPPASGAVTVESLYASFREPGSGAPEERCPECFGYGELNVGSPVHEPSPCPACGGDGYTSGFRKCPACQPAPPASGAVTVESLYASYREPASGAPCRECGGEIRNPVTGAFRPCPVCGGRGKYHSP
jgi:hypothetical protein